MTSALEKFDVLEGHAEKAEGLEQNKAEAPEYNEAGLRELVDNSHKLIDSEQVRILSSASARVEKASQSIGLDETQAVSIQKGHIGQIEGIKGRIVDLGENTKHLTQEVLKPASGAEGGTEQEKANELNEISTRLSAELQSATPDVSKIKAIFSDFESKVGRAQMVLMENSNFSSDVFQSQEYIFLRDLIKKAAGEVSLKLQELFDGEMVPVPTSKVESQPVSLEQIEAQSNFQGNNTTLMVERLRSPRINDQLARLIHLDRKYDLSVSTSHTLEEVKAEEAAIVSAVSEYTPITFSGEMPDANMLDGVRENMDIRFKYPEVFGENGVKQKSITEAHEKGHTIRKVRSEAAARFFNKGFDFKSISIPADRLKNIREYFHSCEPESPMPSDSEVYESISGYLSNPMELIERMSQLKNYFGMSGEELFTREHLTYAREHYVADTKIDNHMSEFFQSITPQTEEVFLSIINNTGI